MRFVAIVVLMALSVVHLSADPIAALTLEDQRASLRGLPGVGLVIESLRPDTKADGLSEDSIRNAVELILRSSGIRIIDEDPEIPYLYVNEAELIFYAFNIIVDFKQVMSLVDRPEWSGYATTWEQTVVGHVGAQKIRQVISSIEQMVKKFANDFLAANPK